MSAIMRNDSPPGGWLSVSETAARLGVAAPTVRRWIKSGRISAAQPGGEQGVFRVPLTELDRLAGETHDRC